MSPAEGISAILAAANPPIYSAGWTRYVGKLGANQNAIATLDQPGKSPEVLVGIDYPSIQILGRGDTTGDSYSVLYGKMKDVWNLLHAIPEHPTQFPDLVSCLVRGGIASLGNDGNDRPLLALNFDLITSPTTLGHRDLY